MSKRHYHVVGPDDTVTSLHDTARKAMIAANRLSHKYPTSFISVWIFRKEIDVGTYVGRVHGTCYAESNMETSGLKVVA